MTARCGRCTAPLTDNAVLCHDCTTSLGERLADVPVLLGELDVTFSRQSRISTGPKIAAGKASSVYPDMTLSETTAILRACCSGWAHAYDGFSGPAPWHHLRRNLDKIRLLNWSVMLDSDLANRMSTAWKKIDRPEGKWYAGVCGRELDNGADCGSVLWAALADTVIECRACGSPWSVQERRFYLIRSAEDFELAPRACAAIVSFVLDSRLSENTVKSWLRRGHVIPRQHGPQRVRVGDVIAEVLKRQADVAGQVVTA